MTFCSNGNMKLYTVGMILYKEDGNHEEYFRKFIAESQAKAIQMAQISACRYNEYYIVEEEEI